MCVYICTFYVSGRGQKKPSPDQATKPDTRTAAEKRAQAREALEEAEKLLHQVAGAPAIHSQDGSEKRG